MASICDAVAMVADILCFKTPEKQSACEMKTSEELLRENALLYETVEDEKEGIKAAMREYARQALEEAASRVTPPGGAFVHKQDILQIKDELK
jgi:hypothetical protein